MRVATRNRGDGSVEDLEFSVFKWALGIVLTFAVLIGGCGGAKAFNRYQKRADANNHIAVVKSQTKQQDAKIQLVVKQAEQRKQEAIGIREAQDEIQKTLTPIYVQHEAIQAQERVASSGKNNTIIYTPSGTNGVPLVQTPPLKPTEPAP